MDQWNAHTHTHTFIYLTLAVKQPSYLTHSSDTIGVMFVLCWYYYFCVIKRKPVFRSKDSLTCCSYAYHTYLYNIWTISTISLPIPTGVHLKSEKGKEKENWRLHSIRSINSIHYFAAALFTGHHKYITRDTQTHTHAYMRCDVMCIYFSITIWCQNNGVKREARNPKKKKKIRGGNFVCVFFSSFSLEKTNWSHCSRFHRAVSAKDPVKNVVGSLSLVRFVVVVWLMLSHFPPTAKFTRIRCVFADIVYSWVFANQSDHLSFDSSIIVHSL